MKRKRSDYPSAAQLEAEVARVKQGARFRAVLRSTLSTLLVVAALSILISTAWMPVLQIYGTSMEPTLREDDVVLVAGGSSFSQGDLIAFYIGNKILVKRCIALPGQWVDMDEAGNVYVDGALLDEPYLSEKSLGDANIELPFQVPENRYFCLGDRRASSVDSRHTEVGCIADEQIVGRVVFCIWPPAALGGIN